MMDPLPVIRTYNRITIVNVVKGLTLNSCVIAPFTGNDDELTTTLQTYEHMNFYITNLCVHPSADTSSMAILYGYTGRVLYYTIGENDT